MLSHPSKWSLFLVLLVFWGSAQVARADSPGSLQAAIEQTLQTLIAGDSKKAKEKVITYEELTSLSNHRIDNEKYEKQVVEWVQKRINELQTLKKDQAVTFQGANIEEVMILAPPRDKKVKHRVILALVRPVFATGEETQTSFMSLVFLQVEDRWKLSIRK